MAVLEGSVRRAAQAQALQIELEACVGALRADTNHGEVVRTVEPAIAKRRRNEFGQLCSGYGLIRRFRGSLRKETFREPKIEVGIEELSSGDIIKLGMN